MSYYRNDDDRYTETTTTYSDDQYRNNGRGGRYEDDQYTSTTTTTSYQDDSYRRGGGGPPPPQNLPRPWFSEWDQREQRYIYINQETGERRWDFPRSDRDQYYASENRQYDSYQQDQQRGEERRGGGGHGLLYGALGAAAGLAGGALLVHEGHEMREDWDQGKDRIEQGFDDAPEDAANWVGRKVGQVEDIPDDIANGVTNAYDDVVDAPENVANWVGDKVGDVQRWGDGIGDAYDEGRQEGRDDGGW